MSAESEPLIPGTLTHGKHLGVPGAATLMLNRIIGTGVFSVPSGIYALTGSVGWSLVMWVIGGIIAAAGFCVYFEYGLEMPESGGERKYLQRVYRWPKDLALTMFAFCTVLLSFSSSNSYAFGLYAQFGLGYETPSDQVSRYIAVATVAVISLIHARYPSAGRAAFTYIGGIKVVILILIALCGPLVYFGVLGNEDVQRTVRENFTDIWGNDGFGGGIYEVGTALLRISYSYRGWETCNQVMGEVRDPRRTVGLAAPLAIFGITVLYTLCSWAYFLVVPKTEIAGSGVIIAGVFLLKLFGESVTARILPLCICLSNLGNVLVVTYAMSRVTQSLGQHNILPFSHILSSTRPWGTPVAGLLLHWLMTAVTLLLPPPGSVYNLVVELSTYSVSYFATLITIGLIYLHYNRENEHWGGSSGSWKSPLPATLLFLIANLMMLILPCIPPPSLSQSRDDNLPYYATPLACLVVLMFSAGYWWYHQRLYQDLS